MTPRILGLAASLRNARWGRGNETLIRDLESIETEDALKSYLVEQSDLHLENFVSAGRDRGLGFDDLYKNLKSLKGDRGLSNSEVALAAGLWAARNHGAEIEHVSLAEHFPASDRARDLDVLKERLRAADGILVSGPVYFGDRGSLAQSLVDLIRDDDELRADLADRVYAGIAVGAKRNGGQETTLIYQLLDMLHCGLFGVGNDSDTTSQYGGTGHAGDVGTMGRDDYGLQTAMGTGRRIAKIARIARAGRDNGLVGPLRVMLWVLQDRDGEAQRNVRRVLAASGRPIELTVVDATEGHVNRCIACDICPTNVDVDQTYRCIIKSGRDSFSDWHDSFLDQDLVVPVVYSAGDRSRLSTNYQTFIERTRYLRRGDYVLGDVVTAPFVLQDLGVHEHLDVRLVTSMIRHHTVVGDPVVGYLRGGELLNADDIDTRVAGLLDRSRALTAGRLRTFLDQQHAEVCRYNPVGYVLSAEKDREDEKLRLREEMQEDRRRRQRADALRRLAPHVPATRAG